MRSNKKTGAKSKKDVREKVIHFHTRNLCVLKSSIGTSRRYRETERYIHQAQLRLWKMVNNISD